MKPLIFVGSLLVTAAVGFGQTPSYLLGANTAVNYTPVVNPQLIVLNALQPVTLTLSGYDADGDALTFSIVTQPSHGILSQFNPTSGQVTYNPPSQVFVTDSFTFSATDGIAQSSPATVTVILKETAPTISKVFSPTSIQSGGSSTVTLTLTNSNATALTSGAFTDTLSKMSASGGLVGGTCVGTTPSSLAAGTTALSFTGITIPGSSSCTVTFTVTSSTVGSLPNKTSGVKTTQTPTAGAASNSATLSVLIAPTISKAFSPTSILSGGTSTVTLTLRNSNNIAVTGATFTDNLTNMSAAGGSIGGTCAGTMPTSLAAGATALNFSGITIPASQSCTVIFKVSSSTLGSQPNATSGVKTTQTPAAGIASNTATLNVGLPTIAKAFSPTFILVGGTSTVTLTLKNTNDTPLTGGAFSDTLSKMSTSGGPLGGTCVGTTPTSLAAGATALSFSGITIPAHGSCTVTFSVTSSTVGSLPNKTSGIATAQTPTAGSPSNTAILDVGAPTISKVFSPTSIQSGGSSTVTLTLTNSNATALTSGAFTDTLSKMSASGGLVGGTCVGTTPSSLAAGTTALSFTGITIPGSSSCTVTFTVTSSTVGSLPNKTSGVKTTQTPTAGAASNSATLTVTP